LQEQQKQNVEIEYESGMALEHHEQIVLQDPAIRIAVDGVSAMLHG
jgi:hypothetical protein